MPVTHRQQDGHLHGLLDDTDRCPVADHAGDHVASQLRERSGQHPST